METQNQLNSIKKNSFLSQEFTQLQNKKQAVVYFFMFLTFLTVAFFGFFVLRPALSTISTLQKQLEDNRTIYEGLQNKLATIQGLDRQYQTIQTEVPLINEAIPDTPKIPLLTRQIETIAQSNNVSLESLLVSPVELYPLENGSFTFTFDATGTLQDTERFMENISNFSRAVTIDKISTGKNEDGEIELSMSGKAYFGTK